MTPEPRQRSKRLVESLIRRCVVWSATLTLCLLRSALSAETTIIIDTAAISHSFFGFGTQIWPIEFNKSIENLLLQSDIDYVRFSSAPNWGGGMIAIPKDSTDAEMNAFVSNSFKIRSPTLLPKSKKTFEFCKKNGIKVVLLMWSAPEAWRPVKNRLLPEYADDLARLWGSTLYVLSEQGMRPDYIELSNEPEGEWNTYIAPEIFNDLVKLVRKELDRRGFQNIGIVGPGVSAQVGDKWINALDDEGVKALGAWSAHNYESAARGVEAAFQPFVSAANAKDKSKPVMVTEYSTKITNIAGQEFRSNSDDTESGSMKASFSLPYAV